MKKRILGITIYVASALLISGGTLVCYLFITNPRLIHTHGAFILFALFASVFSLIVGLKVHRGLEKG